MASDYVLDLDDADIKSLEAVFTAASLESLRDGTASPELEADAKIVDEIIEEAPETESVIEFYRIYKYDPLFLVFNTMDEPGYILGVTKKPDYIPGETVFRFVVPEGTPVLDLGDGVYVLGRNKIISHGPTDNINLVLATIYDEPAVTAAVPTLVLWDKPPADSFHLIGQHDQSSHGGGAKGAQGRPQGRGRPNDRSGGRPPYRPNDRGGGRPPYRPNDRGGGRPPYKPPVPDVRMSKRMKIAAKVIMATAVIGYIAGSIIAPAKKHANKRPGRMQERQEKARQQREADDKEVNKVLDFWKTNHNVSDADIATVRENHKNQRSVIYKNAKTKHEKDLKKIGYKEVEPGVWSG